MREYQLGDDEVAILSIDRQRRIALEVTATLLRNLPGIDPAAAKACANNLACAWGDVGAFEKPTASTALRELVQREGA